MLKRRLDLWLPDYVAQAPARYLGRVARRKRLTHILFLICDHYEPRHHVKRPEQAFERVATWQREYAKFQAQIAARFGTRPLHTWFYPPHHGLEHLEPLSEMVYAGLGELELHYHHDNDTAQSLRRDLERVLYDYRRWGHLLGLGAPPKPGFGFVHGDWALDNSRHGRYCGVNDELSLLQELGCWADFTMPSADESQTRKINSIYYAKGDPSRPKAHDRGPDARAGGGRGQGLFLMQGPLGINWRAPRYPRIENASLTSSNWGRPDRIRQWIDCQIHVKGQPEWLFVKLHTHGAVEHDFDALFGKKALAMHEVLNAQYNDGVHYRLHYVTARQAFNVARAAESGQSGDPAAWFDYEIAPPVHRLYTLDAPHDLVACESHHLRIENIESDTSVTLQTRIGPIARISGSFAGVELSEARAELCFRAPEGSEVVLSMSADYDIASLESARLIEQSTDTEGRTLRLQLRPGATLRYRTREHVAVPVGALGSVTS